MKKTLQNGDKFSKVQNQKTSDHIINGQSEKSTFSKESVSIVDIMVQAETPLEVILGFGFLTVPDRKFSEFTCEQKEKMFTLMQTMHTIISEVLKCPEERSNWKIMGFLKMAMNNSDEFYKTLGKDDFIFHKLVFDQKY